MKKMKYKVYNGTEWVDICNCDYHVRDTDNTWKLINPKEDEIYVKTESGWSLITCDNTCVRNEALGCSTMGNYVSIGKSIEFTNCSSIVGGTGCSKIVAYIPFTLTPAQVGITFIFSSGESRSNSVWDGLDITDICQKEVLGGLGFFGTGTNITTMVVNPGTYTYDRLIYFDPSLNSGNGGWKDISNEIDPLEITVPTEIYKLGGTYTTESLDSTGTTETVLNTIGYSSTVVPYGDPNTVFITTDKDDVIDSDDHARVFSFIRNPPPIEGYPDEETFLIRVFGHPTETSTKFFIENKLLCLDTLSILKDFCVQQTLGLGFQWNVQLNPYFKSLSTIEWNIRIEYEEYCDSSTINVRDINIDGIGPSIAIITSFPTYTSNPGDTLFSGNIGTSVSPDSCGGTYSNFLKFTLTLNYKNLNDEDTTETFVMTKSDIDNSIYCFRSNI